MYIMGFIKNSFLILDGVKVSLLIHGQMRIEISISHDPMKALSIQKMTPAHLFSS